MRWILGSILTVAAAAALADRPDRNSFIDYPIHSTGDLIQQIRKDPAVADRYERNFAMTEDQVIQYIAGLHLDHLPESGLFDVYSVPPDGHIKWHQQKLQKGTSVFCDASGKPVMLLKCGNPLIMSTPTPPSATPGPPAPMVYLPPTPAEVPPTAMVPAPPPETPADVYVPPSAEPIPPAEAAFSGTGAAVGEANYGWLGFLVAGGVIYGLTTIHGGHHQTPPTPPVPEPASVAFLTLGVTGLLFSHRKKKD
jgi:hypothetical protein